MISTTKRQHFCSCCINRLTELMTFTHAKKKTRLRYFPIKFFVNFSRTIHTPYNTGDSPEEQCVVNKSSKRQRSRALHVIHTLDPKLISLSSPSSRASFAWIRWFTRELRRSCQKRVESVQSIKTDIGKPIDKSITIANHFLIDIGGITCVQHIRYFPVCLRIILH